MRYPRRPDRRSRTARRLLGVLVAAAVTFVVPAIANGATATADPATSLQPAGEVTPTTATDTTTTDPGAQTPPATDPSTGSSGDETTAPDTTVGPDGATPAPAPSADSTTTPAPAPSGTEATPTPAPAPSIATPAPAPSALPVAPDTPAGTGLASGATLPAPAVPDAPRTVVATPSIGVPAAAPDRPDTAAPAAPTAKRVVPPTVQVQDFVSALLGSKGAGGQPGVAPSPADPGPAASTLPEEMSASTFALEAARFVAPMGVPSQGSSLLAVLAGYVLPGGGAAPTSLVLFLIVGLIIGMTAAACPRGLERLAALALVGSADGHERAVARPG